MTLKPTPSNNSRIEASMETHETGHTAALPENEASSNDVGDESTPVVFGPHRTSFLDLSGEIRNLIYDYTSSDLINTTFLPDDYWSPCFYLCLRPGEKAYWNTNLRTSMGLAQVCRKIRSEYRPIYQSKMDIDLLAGNLSRFLQDFYPAIDDAKELCSYYPSISIRFGDPCEKNRTCGSFNLLDVIRLHRIAPDLRLSLHDGCGMLRFAIPELEAVSRYHTHSAEWSDRWVQLLDSVERVMVYSMEWLCERPRMVFVTKSGKKEWIKKASMTKEASNTEFQQFLKEVGLSGVKNWDIFVV